VDTRVKDSAHKRINRLIDRHKKAKRRQGLRTLKDPLDSNASFLVEVQELKISDHKREREKITASKIPNKK